MTAESRDLMRSVGDMMVFGQPKPKLAAALDHLATNLHPAYEMSGKYAPGKSKRSCILMSLIARDFLKGVGFPDAKVMPVTAIVLATKEEKPVHRLALGEIGDTDLPNSWAGHMVAAVPSEGYLIDTTLYQAQRETWPGLPGMMALPVGQLGEKFEGYDVIASMHGKIGDDKMLYMLWVDRPDNTNWRTGNDYLRSLTREKIAKGLVRDFLARQRSTI